MDNTRNTNINRPIQKQSNKAKLRISRGERFPDFIMDTARYYLDNYSYSYDDVLSELNDLLEAGEGNLHNIEGYNYVTNPFNENNPKKLPTRLVNYDILTPIKNLLLGERSDVHMDFQVVSVNSDSISTIKEEMNNAMVTNLTQNAIYMITQKLQAPEQAEGQEAPQDPYSYYKQLSTTYNDKRALIGQEAMNYIYYDCDLKDLEQELYNDYFDTGRCYTFKEVYRDDVYIERVDVRELIPVMRSKSRKLEDAEALIRKTTWTVSEVIDRFRSDLKDEDVEWLETFNTGKDNIDTNMWNGRDLDRETQGVGNVTVCHLEWDTLKLIQVLVYENKLGEIKEMEVDETYKIDTERGDISLKKEWINEKWETYVIEDKLFFEYGAITEQRPMLNNSSSSKSRYNGFISTRNPKRVSSMLKSGLVYQKLYNIHHYQYEKILNKNKEKMMLMPKGLIPKGWKMEKFLYWADATGFAWFDETNPKIAQVLQGMKSIDMGLGNYAEQMIKFMTHIKDEWWDSAGMNRQRYGDVKTSDGKGTTQQATFRSAIITKEMNRRFDNFLESDYQGLLDISKLAWINGKKGWYINSDDRRTFFEVDNNDYPNQDLGIFVKSSTNEKEKLSELKEYGKFLIQNGLSPDLMPEILDANNFGKIKSIIAKGTRIQKEREDAENAANRQSAEFIEETKNKTKYEEGQIKIQQSVINYKGLVDSARISAKASLDAHSLSDSGVDDDILDKVNEYINNGASADRIAKADGDSKALDRQLKRETNASKERIAVENKN